MNESSQTSAVPAPGSSPAAEIFYSYSNRDEESRDRLEIGLSLLQRQSLISQWHDRKIVPGTDWRNEIDQHLDTAQVILFLVSADFIASDYCWDVEVKRALERHRKGDARVVPIILRPCDWQSSPFAGLQALPKGAKP